MGLDFFIHQGFHLVRLVRSQCHQADIVTQECDRGFAVVEFRKLLKQVTFLGIFDMLLQRQHALHLHEFEHRVEKREQFEKAFFVVARSLQQSHRRLDRGFYNSLGIGDDEGTDGGTDNDDEFDRLNQNLDMAAHHYEAANDAYDNRQAAND